MASQTIKGLTVEISGDTTKLGTAIKDAESKSKSLGKELTDVNKMLKLDPTNVELLTQKQQILTDRVTATKEKLDILREAEAQVQAQFEKGEISEEQLRAFQREIIYTTNEMEGYEKAVEKANQQLTQARVEQGEEISTLEALRTKISLQDKELASLNEEYQNAVVQYGKNSEQAETLATRIKTLSDERKAETNKLEEAEQATREITATEKTLAEQYQEQKEKLADLKQQYANAVVQYGKNSKEAKTLAKQITELSEEIAEEDKKMQSAEKSADSFDKTITDTSKDTDNASENIDKLGETAQKAKEGLNAAAVAVGTFMGNLAIEVLQKAVHLMADFTTNTIETGKSFETSMSKVESLSGATTDELEQLTQTSRQYGRDTQYTASQVADAFGYMALAGWNTENMLDGIPGVLNLAAASEMDLAKASDIVTDYMTAFGWEAERASDFADRMAYAMAHSNTNTEQLGEAYKNCASTANSLHYSMEEVTAVLMTMANAGVKGGEAGTAVNAVMTRLATDTKNCASELKQYGVEIYDEQGNMKSLSSILTGISETWETLTDEQQANLAKIIAGQQQYSSFQTIMQGMSDTAKENGQSFEDYTEALLNCDDAAAQMAETMTDNLEGDLKRLESAYQDLQLSIYEGVNAPLRAVVQTVTSEVLPAISDLISGVDGADKAVGQAVGNLVNTILQESMNIIPQFAEILGTLGLTLLETIPDIASNLETTVFSLINNLLDKLPEILPTISKTIRRLLSQVFNSIGQLGGVAGNLVKYIAGAIINELPKISTMLTSAISTVISDWLPEIVNQIPELVTTLSSALTKNLPVFLSSLQKILSTILSGLSPVISKLIPQLLQTITQFLNNGIPLLLNTAIQLFSTIINAIPEVITALAEALPEIITTIIGVLLENMPVLLDSVVTLLSVIIEAIPEIITALAEALPEIIEKLIDFLLDDENINLIFDSAFTLLSALIDCIPEVIALLVPKVAEMIMSIITTISEKLPEMASKGQELFENLIKNSKEIIEKIILFIPELITSIVGAISENYKELQEAGMNMFEKLKEGITSSLSQAWEWGKDLIHNFIDGIFDGENGITKAAENIGERIWEYLHFSEPEKGKLSDFSTYAPDMMKTFASGIRENTTLVINQIVNLSGMMAEQAKNTGKKFLDGIQLFTKLLPDRVKAHLTETINRVTTWGKDMKNTAISAMSSVVNAIENTVRSLPDKMAEVGRNLVRGLWNGMQEMTGWILSKVTDFCDGILNSIFDMFDIHSPAGTTKYVGKMLDYGMMAGVEENQEKPIKAIRRMASDLLNETAIIPERIEAQQQYQMPMQNTGFENMGAVSAQLTEILQAIRAGQVLVLDSNKLVGATASQMNTELGKIQAISARR